MSRQTGEQAPVMRIAVPVEDVTSKLFVTQSYADGTCADGTPFAVYTDVQGASLFLEVHKRRYLVRARSIIEAVLDLAQTLPTMPAGEVAP